MTTTLVVGTADLRQALTAVRVHASTDSETPDLKRIRLTVDPQNLSISATDRFTCGLAIVSIWELEWEPEDHNDPGTVELLLEDVAKLLTVFKAPTKDGGEDGPQYTLRFEIGPDEVTVTDCSGFDIVGRQLRLPRLETADALDLVPQLIDRIHGSQLVLLDGVKDMTVNGEYLVRFKAAASAYDRPLSLETRGEGRSKTPTILVRCGESFLGLLMPRTLLDEDVQRHREWATAWTVRLPQIVAAAGSEA
jgi:hypothetical protein